jgi:fatty acid-binding protein DegV
LIVEAAGKAASSGKNIDEILALIKDISNRTYTFAAVDNLNYLQRSGRISHLTSSLGSLLQIKPILQMSQGKSKWLFPVRSKAQLQNVGHLARIGEYRTTMSGPFKFT